jgi:glycosyltransferase involved in cell wall biosynthesis
MEPSAVITGSSLSNKKLVGMEATKIAYVVTSEWWGGGPMSLLSLLSALDRTCFQPVVISCTSQYSRGFQIFSRELQKQGVRHLSIKSLYGATQSSARLLRGVSRLPSLLINVFKVYAALKREKVALVHTNDSYSNLFGSLAAKLAGLRLIYTVHLPSDLTFDNTWLPARPLVALADKVVPTCFDFLRVASERGYNLSRFCPIHTGVRSFETYAHNDCRLTFSSGFAWNPHRRPIVALIGRVAFQKGHKVLIEAARTILQAVTEVQILIVGNLQDRPDYVNELSHLIKDYQLSDHVFLTGFCNNMPELFRQIDVLVLPSLSESVPMVVLEAMQAAKPVVASAIGGIPEVVADGETGLLFPVGDSAALADRVTRILLDRTMARRLGERGRERVLSEFSPKHMAREHESLYQELLTIS